MYGFLAGFSSPESIFAEKLLISCFVTTFKKQEMCHFFLQDRIISHQLLLHR